MQVKAGTSFFNHPTLNGWKYYPEAKHRDYWEAFPLPVLLILHDTMSGLSYWLDVRQQLRTPDRVASTFLEVSRSNQLQATIPSLLFETAGLQRQEYMSDLDDVLKALVNAQSQNGSFPVSHFDLFTHGLTNICRSIYFGTDLALNAAEINLLRSGSEFGVGMGGEEHDFLFSFVKFLISQNLAVVDFSDCLIDWVDREMQPHFVAPLTSRGRSLVKLIGEKENALVEANRIPDGKGLRVAQEGFFQMVEQSYFPRIERIEQFQKVMLERPEN